MNKETGVGEIKPRDIIEFETTFGRVKCHDGDHVWFPRYFGESIAGQINGRKCFVALGFDAPLKYSELKSDYDRLKAEYDTLVSGDILDHESAQFRILKDEHNKLEKDLASAKELIGKLKDTLSEFKDVQFGVSDTVIYGGVTYETLKKDKNGEFLKRYPAREALKEIEQWEAGK